MKDFFHVDDDLLPKWGIPNLFASGAEEEWGAGEESEKDKLPSAPTGLKAVPANGFITISWEPAPNAMYYNLYYLTSKGVMIKPNDLARPIASTDDFIPILGVTKEKGTCIEGSSAPYVHNDLANGTCYHYIVTVVTADGESPESEEVMTIPSPYLPILAFGTDGVDDGEFRAPTGIAIDGEGYLYVADTDNHSIQKFDKDGNFIARWGGEADSEEGSFYYPRGLATTAEGYVFVADSGNNRVQKFDPDGNFMHAWGKFGFAWRGAEAGSFDVPWGVATDQQGNLVVSDTSNARIQKFQSDGTPLIKWGRDGSFDGAFFYPRGMGVDFVGNIFIADEGNHRIQKFDSRGNFLMKWGKEGNGPGQFKSPWGVACDALGNVYVVDSSNHRLQKFDSNGTYLCSWGNRGLTEGQVNFPSGIAVDKEGYVYVVDSGNNRVIKFAPTEEELMRGREKAEQAAQLEGDSSQLVALLAGKPGDTEAILSWLDVPGAASYNLYFNTSPEITLVSATKIEGVMSPHNHLGLSNSVPYFYALTCVNEEGVEGPLSQVVDITPVLIDLAAPQSPDIVLNHGGYMVNSLDVVATISAKDMDTGVAGYFISENPMSPSATLPGWIEVEPEFKFGATIPFALSPGDGPKTVYVWFKDVGNNISVPASANILLNTSGYVCTGTWGKPGRGASLLHGGEFMAPVYGLTIDRQGSVFAVDNGNNRIQKFENNGNFILLWGNFGQNNGNFNNPTALACDGKGDVYVCDTNNHRVQKFDGKLGHFLKKFGTRGNGEGQFNAPWGIAIDRVRGYIYVVDSANFRVQKFDEDGEVVMAWGSFGNNDGQFYFARGIAVDQNDGMVYVVDMGNHRIQKFDTSTNVLPQLVAKWGGGLGAGHASSAQAQDPGQFRSPWGIAIDSVGDVYVADTGNQRIQKFDRDGNFITQWGGFGNTQGQFNFPYGISVDAKGHVFVIDSGNMRVQHFMPAEDAQEFLQDEAESVALLAEGGAH
ncbi:MAG: 6-bladed beta-propeller [Nitrospirota bacterium]|nr:6-bladed beta-propeller [Nitrospirota bacterium]